MRFVLAFLACLSAGTASAQVVLRAPNVELPPAPLVAVARKARAKILTPAQFTTWAILGGGFFGLPPASAASSFALIANTSAAATNSPATSGVTTTGANLIVISGTWYTNGTATIEDSKSNTWTSAVTVNNSNGFTTAVWYSYAPTVGASHTFTLSGSGIYGSLQVSAWSGSASSPLDQTSSNNGTLVGNTIQPGSITPGQNNELIITAFGVNDAGSGAYTANSGFTVSNSNPYLAGTYYGSAQAYLLQGAKAAVNPTWTDSVSLTGGLAVMASFK